jgi:hypothetical protein
MIKVELLKKNKKELSDIFSFWGLREKQGIETLLRKMKDKLSFAVSCSSLNRDENIVLSALISSNGVLIKGDLHGTFEDHKLLNGIINKLINKALIYVRKNRMLLTDKLDKIYLFPEHKAVLESYDIYEKTRLKKHLVSIIHPLFLQIDNLQEDLRQLLYCGGYLPLHSCPPLSYKHHFEEGSVDIALLKIGQLISPVWIIKEGAERDTQVNLSHISIKQNLYFNDIINIIDCLRYKPLKKKGAPRRRAVTDCLKTVIEKEERKKEYLRDLYELEVLREENDAYILDDSFVKFSYREKIQFLTKKLTDKEKTILRMVEHRKPCTPIFVISSVVSDSYLTNSADFNEGKREERLRTADEFERALKRLIFRGFLVEDFRGIFLKANTFKKDMTFPEGLANPKTLTITKEMSIPKGLSDNGSVVVTTDFEIIVYTDRISHYALYVLAGFTHIMDRDEIIRLKIERVSVTRGITYFGDVKIFTDVLSQNAQGKIAVNVIDSIREWAQSYLSVRLHNYWIIHIESPDAKLKLLHNSYLRSMIEEDSDSTIILKNVVDIDRLKQELKKENIYIDVSKSNVETKSR